jgi:predicted DNA-binding transcriptional regulator AlpA
MTAPDWRTAEAAAHYLGVTTSTLAKYRLTGEGPKFARIGKRIAYLKEDLDAWMLSRRVTSTAETPSHRRPNAGRKKAEAA